MSNNDFKIDFIGIGAEKSATTWIFECLKEHPEVCPSAKKETRFFNKPRKYKRGIEYYQKSYKHCSEGKIKGEFDPTYLASEKVAERIHEYFPDAKLIVSLRDPIERALSQYRAGNKMKNPLSIYSNLKEAIQKSPHLKKKGFYFKHLKKFFEKFSRENILVILYGEIKSNPKNKIKDLYKFLDIDSEFSPPVLNNKKGVTGTTRTTLKHSRLTKLLYKLTNKIKQNQSLYNTLDKSILGRLHTKLIRWNKSKKTTNQEEPTKLDEIPPETRKELRKIYSEDIKKLEQLIDKDLSHWKDYEQ